MTESDLADLNEAGKPWSTMMVVNEWIDTASVDEADGVEMMVDDWDCLDDFQKAVAAQYMFGQIVTYREMLSMEDLDESD